jgi:hypothetical protein
LNYHLHIHAVNPAPAINKQQHLWREKPGKYLFNHKVLARVFRAKILEAMVRNRLRLPDDCPQQWVFDCQSVGSGGNTLIYLGWYLYRGVIQEKDILSCRDGKVTFLNAVYPDSLILIIRWGWSKRVLFKTTARIINKQKLHE